MQATFDFQQHQLEDLLTRQQLENVVCMNPAPTPTPTASQYNHTEQQYLLPIARGASTTRSCQQQPQSTVDGSGNISNNPEMGIGMMDLGGCSIADINEQYQRFSELFPGDGDGCPLPETQSLDRYNIDHALPVPVPVPAPLVDMTMISDTRGEIKGVSAASPTSLAFLPFPSLDVERLLDDTPVPLPVTPSPPISPDSLGNDGDTSSLGYHNKSKEVDGYDNDGDGDMLVHGGEYHNEEYPATGPPLHYCPSVVNEN